MIFECVFRGTNKQCSFTPHAIAWKRTAALNVGDIVCESCAPEQEQDALYRLRYYGLTPLEKRSLELLSTLMAHVGRDSKSDMVCSDCLHPIEQLIEDLHEEALKE